MTASQDRKARALTHRPSTAPYDVGYGKPPQHTQFQPGQSGNPKGRPKGSKGRQKPPALHEERLKAIILEEAYRSITINDAKGPVSIPMAQAIVRSLSFNAAKGNQRAQRLFTELLGTTERDRMRAHDEWVQTAIEYKVEWDRELERRNRLGITGPDPLPHPDHVIIDLQSGTAHIRGPATKEEKAELERWERMKAVVEEELEEFRAMVADPDCPDRDSVVHQISLTEKALAVLARVLEDGRIPNGFPELRDYGT